MVERKWVEPEDKYPETLYLNEKGDVAEGLFIGSGTVDSKKYPGQKSTHFTIQINGEKRIIWAKGNLKRKMINAGVGAFIRIEHMGMEKKMVFGKMQDTPPVSCSGRSKLCACVMSRDQGGIRFRTFAGYSPE